MSYLEREAKTRRRAWNESIEDIAASLQVDEVRIERALLGDSVVRVVVRRPPADSTFNSFLKSMEAAGAVKIHRESDGTICFDVLPPHDIPDSKHWAGNVATVMLSQNFNAVVAPRWADD